MRLVLMRNRWVEVVLLLALQVVVLSGHAAESAIPDVSVSAADPAPAQYRLVFGSFARQDNANAYASTLTETLSMRISVIADEREARFRVVSAAAPERTIDTWRARAATRGLNAWRLVLEPSAAPAAALSTSSRPALSTSSRPALSRPARDADTATGRENTPSIEGALVADPESTSVARESTVNWGELSADVALQSRLFARAGSNTSDQSQVSGSALIGWNREFSGGANLVSLELFGRWDSDDGRRTHADVRELSVTHVAERWQLQAGVGQVFWGVVEFNHLIDVVNQTDLVENIDTEDKLGQPMVALTAWQDWGSLELFVLPGFRERTLPDIPGRLTLALPIDLSETVYESGAEDKRVDALVRLSTQFGGVLFDVYHFNGTRRTPRFELRSRQGPFAGAGQALVPVYDTVKQTALAAQANSGDTAYKLEALQQDGGPESYWAVAAGIEHTFVGVFGGATDLGAVIEYHYDSRGGRAFDSFFEDDLALGARFAANDIHDSQALFGVVWDTSTQETVVLLEASRRLNDHWSLSLESRWFGGGEPLGQEAMLSEIFDTSNKLGSVQRDDYFQFEFTRFF